VLPAEWAGRAFDRALLAALPAGVDACGERGEFHTFVSDGPMFARPVPVRAGARATRDGFQFVDLLLGAQVVPGASRAQALTS
jgi:diphthamide synthase (EF-2-diphthine--ammonia ligase)